MKRLPPGAEEIISWEPDSSPQVVRVITTSPDSRELELRYWPASQSIPVCDLNYLTMHTLFVFGEPGI
jgi:hypothetical protein